MQKVIVFGIDGATLDLLEPWMDAGELPQLDLIRKQGASGVLRSTIPPYSAPAWVSIVTGVNPGKHGIYDFFRTDSVSKNLVSTGYRKAPAVWNYLSFCEKKCMVVNVPGTYPPEKIHGVMISGLLTPSEESEYTFPPSIKQDLVDGNLGRFDLEQVAVDDLPKSLYARYAPEKLVDRINRATVSHGTVTLNLLRREEWDFAMVVFRGIDDAQHLLWDKKSCILACYKTVDEYLKKIMGAFPDAFVVIVSDHGFHTPKRYLYVNNVLFNTGHVKTFSDPRYSAENLTMTIFNKLSGVLFRVIPMEKFARSSFGRRMILSSGEKKNIDFSKTKAVYHSVCSRGVRIIREGPHGVISEEEYERLREEIIHLLSTIIDPETGKRIVKKVYRFEELYGENAVNAPLDLILDLEEGYGTQELLQVPKGTIVTLSSESEDLPVLASPGFYDWVGDHAPNGIVFLYGNGVKSHSHVRASVVDIVPTVLAVMGVSLPARLDGSVIQDAFVTPLHTTLGAWDIPSKSLLSDAEKKKIRDLRM
ncbi:MAG: alkaline phosphatase family protein [Methanobacteriota archaeon]